MEKKELDKLLENVATPIYLIEKELGIPATILQKALKGKRTLPKKWGIVLKGKYGGIGKKEIPVDKPKPDSKWDFTGTVFLQIEDFTEYPKAKCPAGGYERTDYLAKKKEADDLIRTAYQIYKQSKT